VQTNNPRKIEKLEELGIKVTGRIPCLVKPGEFSHEYLLAKGKRMHHMDLDSKGAFWDLGGTGINANGQRAPAIRAMDEQTF
jgi:hypothetical protein